MCLCGCSQTAEQLIAESGCTLEHPSAAKLRAHVTEGSWEKVSNTQINIAVTF